MLPPLLHRLQGGQGQQLLLLLLLLLLVPGWGEGQVQVGGPAANQDIEVLSHICKYGVHPGGRR